MQSGEDFAATDAGAPVCHSAVRTPLTILAIAYKYRVAITANDPAAGTVPPFQVSVPRVKSVLW